MTGRRTTNRRAATRRRLFSRRPIRKVAIRRTPPTAICHRSRGRAADSRASPTPISTRRRMPGHAYAGAGRSCAGTPPRLDRDRACGAGACCCRYRRSLRLSCHVRLFRHGSSAAGDPGRSEAEQGRPGLERSECEADPGSDWRHCRAGGATPRRRRLIRRVLQPACDLPDLAEQGQKQAVVANIGSTGSASAAGPAEPKKFVRSRSSRSRALRVVRRPPPSLNLPMRARSRVGRLRSLPLRRHQPQHRRSVKPLDRRPMVSQRRSRRRLRAMPVRSRAAMRCR